MNRKYLTAIVVTMMAGCFFYLLHHEYIMVILPHHFKSSSEIATYTQRSVTLFVPDITKSSCIPEEANIKISAHVGNNHEELINTWLAAQTFTPSNTILQSVTLCPDQKNIFINFKDKSPLPAQASIHDKLLWTQGLLTTLHAYNNTIEYVYFLVNDQPLTDYELDFSKPWPVQGFL